MPIPSIFPFPVRRPNFITEATWLGGDDDLSLQIKYLDIGGITRSMSFTTRNIGASQIGEICVPTSSDLNNLGPRARDVLVAHTRMSCMIAGRAIPGSKEFSEAQIHLLTDNYQTAIGTVGITNIDVISDQLINLTYKKGNGPAYVIQVDHGELNSYTFAPDTQLLIVPGAVEKAFPTYVHDYPSSVLTQSQKDNVVAEVLGLSPWI